MTTNDIATSLNSAIVADHVAEAIDLVQVTGFESLHSIVALIRGGELQSALAALTEYNMDPGYGCLREACRHLEAAIG